MINMRKKQGQTLDELYDIAVIGCGPAGLSAALNAKIRNKNIKIFGTGMCSIKMHKSPNIFNYLGCSGLSGEEFPSLDFNTMIL